MQYFELYLVLGFRARLPCKAAGQSYMHAMAQYAEQLKAWCEIGRKCIILSKFAATRTTKQNLDPHCTNYERTNAGKNASFDLQCNQIFE
jgi:hypothetical protein